MEALPQQVARAKETAGQAALLSGVEPGDIASREALAELPVIRKGDLMERQADMPPFGGLNRLADGKLTRLFLSPGPIAEPQGRRPGLLADGPRAARRRVPRGRHRAQLLLLPLHPGRHDVRRGSGGDRLSGHPGRHRPDREPDRGDPAFPAGRLCRHARLPQDHPRQGGQDRRRRLLDPPGRGRRRRPAPAAPQGIRRPGHRRPAILRHGRCRSDRLRVRSPRRHDPGRGDRRRDRAPRDRRPRCPKGKSARWW